jgi:hypothetical protein
MEKPINSKIEDLRNDAANQEELMKSLAQIDEEGQLTDDVLDAVSGGRGVAGIPIIAGGMPTGGPEPFPGDILF